MRDILYHLKFLKMQKKVLDCTIWLPFKVNHGYNGIVVWYRSWRHIVKNPTGGIWNTELFITCRISDSVQKAQFMVHLISHWWDFVHLVRLWNDGKSHRWDFTNIQFTFSEISHQWDMNCSLEYFMKLYHTSGICKSQNFAYPTGGILFVVRLISHRWDLVQIFNWNSSHSQKYPTGGIWIVV